MFFKFKLNKSNSFLKILKRDEIAMALYPVVVVNSSEQSDNHERDTLPQHELRGGLPHPSPSPSESYEDIPNEREEASLSVIDFGLVAVLSRWARHNKNSSVSVLAFWSVLEFVCYLVTLISYDVIIFGKDKIREGQNFKLEQGLTITMLVGTYLINLCQKYRADALLNNWNGCKSSSFKKLKYLLQLVVFSNRPVRIFKAFMINWEKAKITGKRFIHGQTVTKEGFNKVFLSNKEELEMARDDLYECYIQLIPTVIIQLYFFQNLEHPIKLCNFRDGCRFLLIAIYLIFTIKSVQNYEWKKRVYVDSLHVHGYIQTNGRFLVPDFKSSTVTSFLDVGTQATSLLARIYMICFFATLSWIYLVAAIVLIFFIVMLMTVAATQSICSVHENFPEGLSLNLYFVVDRWINIFVTKDTRLNEVTRGKVKFSSRFSSRIPLVFIQIIPFILTYLIIFVIAKSYDNNTTTDGLHYATNVGTELVNGTLINVTLHAIHMTSNVSTQCPQNNNATNMLDWYEISSFVLHLVGQSVNIGVASFDNLFSPIHFHFLNLYAQVIMSVIRNWYIVKMLEPWETPYPPILVYIYLKSMFQKILSMNSQEEKVEQIKKLLFLFSLDLPAFNELYDDWVSPDDSWWQRKINSQLVKKAGHRVSHRYFERAMEQHDLIDILHFDEVIEVTVLAQSDLLTTNVYLYCTTRIEEVLAYGFTSLRLAKTIEMMNMSVEDICGQTMNKMFN